jgi:hypothetical protein
MNDEIKQRLVWVKLYEQTQAAANMSSGLEKPNVLRTKRPFKRREGK